MIAIERKGERKAQGEVAAATGTRSIADLAAVFAREPLRKGESEAGALDAAGERVVRTIKCLEDFRFFPRRHARTAIEDRHPD
jgi:hypothetical protein